ncbi:MAG: nuclear transport factor 2 family protein [Gammaproteobacteria bacterium]|jgi:3-phenylpropionate/cinnamic acid dioxygenase small subunit|nr:nuclear transport factor 2 family protein [Gammaproteobacteria bacterium]MBT4493487.1 nuclear transport factor 2 family protein [Gammaproteobacteria bacterium]MBT7370109.1 nuclear transport factor 2 family protein [Gammaproteobacteria bacterium]
MKLTLEDKIELIELAGRYGDAMDDRDWEALTQVFTEDAVFDVPTIDAHMVGLEGIKSFMDENEHLHPGAHLMTNIHSLETPNGIELHFRGILPRTNVAEDGSTSVVHGSYYDKVVKTEAGWRVKDRVFLIERRDKKK